LHVIRFSDNVRCMDEIIAQIFTAFGGQTKLAQATGLSISTVDSWKNARNGKPNIPEWRRSLVLATARRLNIELPSDAVLYLSQAIAA